jgi:hypothetical protein
MEIFEGTCKNLANVSNLSAGNTLNAIHGPFTAGWNTFLEEHIEDGHGDF